MATQRQIEANTRNAQLSSGPSRADSPSRGNAAKHGLASESVNLEARLSPEFVERRAKWAAEQGPVGEAANFALDRVVAATFRIERCEHALDAVIFETRKRAELAWEQDRAVEAATLLGRLGRDPVLASRQLQANLAGACLLIEAWLGLLAALEVGDWSEAEASKALDLLGVAPDFRSGRTLIDAPEGSDPVAFRRALALEEVQGLEQLRDASLAPLDEMERRRAMAGNVALLSKPAKLILRYEREAWRRYNTSMAELKAQSTPAIAPAPAVIEPPKSLERPASPAAPSRREERRDSPAVAGDFLAELEMDGKDARLDRRIEALPTGRGSVRPSATERTQFVDLAVGRAS